MSISSKNPSKITRFSLKMVFIKGQALEMFLMGQVCLKARVES